ncbi:SDR family oxidoreductase [Candidatus Pinguicoccus supinus]|uniref:SDR family oxidoreductase n=1 Tax=Candidatus Pinguicoccus supinus TaxID=2529394 RepID=A0A7T0BRP5_9BACT|nr:SDR family oxidoreductase [Candidatus Pinguicoccus supinus]
MKTNLYSCFFFIKFFVKKMLTKRWGRIINVSSVVAIIGNAGQLNYITSKAGILGLTKGLAKEVSQRNITINSILPGFIETEMTKFINESTIKLIKNFIPSRKFGLPEDIAYSIKFLCSESANYINGHSLVIDGGLSVY